MLIFLRSLCFMQRMKQLLLTFFLVLFLAPSAQGVDFDCPGGQWVLVSYTDVDLGIVIPYPCYVDPGCPGALTTTTSGSTKTDFHQFMFAVCEYCNCGCRERTWVYEWRCCTDGQTQACVTVDGRCGNQTCNSGEWGVCRDTEQCCEGSGH